VRSGAPPAAGSVGLLGEELDIEEEIVLDYAPFLDAFEAAFRPGEARPVLLFETSRGCSWAERNPCSFCGLNGLCLTYRSMSPGRALASIRSLFRWVPRCPSFIAVDTLMPPEYPDGVFPRLGAPEEMRIMYEVRPVLGPRQIAAIRAGGVTAVQPGIEALSTHTLRLMRKGVTAFQNIRFLKDCSPHAISLDWNLLIGSPGEPESTWAKYLRDLPLLHHLAPPAGAFPINFVRHSRYFEEADAFGLDLRPQDFYAMTFPFPAEQIRSIAYHFVDARRDPARLDPWLRDLCAAIALWRLRWQGADGRPQARLCRLRDNDGDVVYDSRSGEEIEHVLTAPAGRALDALETPRGMDGLCAAAALGAAEAKPAVDWLLARGLLFEEDGRMLSLVTS
jgi:magnesium-protoporphyrin IX monomethyl ester (oxidative) cyclase